MFYGVQLFTKLPFCYLEHLDSLRLGHAKRLMGRGGLCSTCWISGWDGIGICWENLFIVSL